MADTPTATLRDSLLNYVATTTASLDLANLKAFLGITSSSATLQDIINASGSKLIFAGDGHIFTHGKDLLSAGNLLKNLAFSNKGVVIVSDSSTGQLTTSSITLAELNTLSGIATNTTIQELLDLIKRLATGGMTFEGIITSLDQLNNKISSSNTARTVGDTYRITLSSGTITIPASTLASDSINIVKNGDTVIIVNEGTADSPVYKWTVIPSGDDIEDTWRIIKVNSTDILGGGTSTGYLNLISGIGITVAGVTTTGSSAHGDITITLQLATDEHIGGVKVAAINTEVTGVYNSSTTPKGYIKDDTTNGKRYAILMSNTGVPYVNIPWIDTWRKIYLNGTSILDSLISTKPINIKQGSGISINGSSETNYYSTTIALLPATDQSLGGFIAAGSSSSTGVSYNTNGKGSDTTTTNSSGNYYLNINYGVLIDGDHKAFVIVPLLKYGLTTATINGTAQSVVAIDSVSISGTDGLFSPLEKYNLIQLVAAYKNGSTDTWRPILVNSEELSSGLNSTSNPERLPLNFVSTESGIIASCTETTVSNKQILNIGFSLAWYNISTGKYELPNSSQITI